MSSPYVGEIRMFGGNFAPSGWAWCNGSLMSIAENEALFSLIGTYYGGDGQETFALPNLTDRVPLHQGQGPGLSNAVIADMGGVKEVTLTTAQLPAHRHTPTSATSATSTSPAGGLWAPWAASGYSNETPSTQMSASALGFTGGNQPHDNLMPFLVVTFIISLFGVYPSRA